MEQEEKQRNCIGKVENKGIVISNSEILLVNLKNHNVLNRLSFFTPLKTNDVVKWILTAIDEETKFEKTPLLLEQKYISRIKAINDHETLLLLLSHLLLELDLEKLAKIINDKVIRGEKN